MLHTTKFQLSMVIAIGVFRLVTRDASRAEIRKALDEGLEND